jgi:Zn finger protein HypA/HybF involved in hydrogenase expression
MTPFTLSSKKDLMNDASAITPADRATAIFEAEPDAVLRCSHCGHLVTDADAECPTCESPIDWGASSGALRAWEQSGGGA